MQLIKELPKENGKKCGIFVCPKCGEEVSAGYYNGLKAKQCLHCWKKSKSGETNPNYRHGGCINYKKLYMVWGDMIGRTTNFAHKRAKDYILRGIFCCQEWHSFNNFKDWALSNGYKHGLTIDRIDNDSEYGPENCRWVTNTENIRNSRRTKLSTDKVKEIKKMLKHGVTAPFIADKLNCSTSAVYDIKRNKTWRDVI